jgi:hypothetical protein
MEFEESMFDPLDIADCIDHWYGKDITEFSQMGRRWAEKNTWEELKPSYMGLLRSML